MKVAILSDTHDQIEKLEQVCQILKDKSCEIIIHCGDWCSPFIVKEILNCDLPVYGVLGNNDGEHFTLGQLTANSHGKLYIEKEILEVEIDGIKIAVNHYPEIGNLLFDSNKYDLVCYGHNHTRFKKSINGRWLINPGALVRSQVEKDGFMIFDTLNKTIEVIEL